MGGWWPQRQRRLALVQRTGDALVLRHRPVGSYAVCLGAVLLAVWLAQPWGPVRE